MSQVYKNGILYINDEPVIHEGSTGYAEMVQYSWVTVGGQKVVQPFISRVYAKDLKNLSNKLKVNGFRVATMDSYFEKSYGDELSDAGVISGTKGGKAHFTTGSPTVSVDGVPVVRRGDLIICNNGNSQVGAWVEEVPGAPTFQSKLTSTPLNESTAIKKLKVAIGVNPSDSHTTDRPTLPFERGLLVSSQEGASKRYRHTAGVTAESGFLIYEFDVNEGASYEIKECLNDPYGALYEVPQGNATISATNTPGDIVLVALDIKIYRTIAFDVRDVSSMHLNSWLYLFKDGHVWREFQHWQRHKNLCEVNLIEHAGKDVRPTQLMIGRGILLTVQDQSGGHEYGYAVSSVQWQWKTIEAFGGVVPGVKSADVKALQQKRVTRFYPEALFSEAPTIDPNTHTCTKGVAWAVYPKEAVPPKIHPNEAFYQKTHPHIGTLYVKDPLGNALIEAKMISTLYNAHLQFLSDNEGLYQSAALVGSVLDAFEEQGKNYRDLVHEEARVKHGPMFEETVKNYDLAIKERVSRLQAFVRQSIEMRVWDEYTDEQTYHAIQYWGYLGFGLNQTQEGSQYFGELYMDENSHLNQSIEKLKKITLDGTWRTIVFDLADQCSIAATTFEAGPEKVAKWMNQIIPELPKIEIMEVPLSVLMSEEKSKNSQLTLRPHTSVHQFKPGGGVTDLVVDSGISRVVFEDYLSRERQDVLDSRRQRLGNASVKVMTWGGKYIQRVALSVKEGAAVPRAFTALSIMNTRYIYKQIEDKQYDVYSNEWLLIHGELIASLLEVLTLLPKASGKTLNAMLQHHWRKPSKSERSMFTKLGTLGSALSALFNVVGYTKAMHTGEVGLRRGYLIGMIGNMLEGLLFILRFKNIVGVFGGVYLKISALVCLVVSFALVAYYTKKQWENWIYHSLWGKSISKKKGFEHDYEELLKIMTLISYPEVKYFETALADNIPNREAIFDEVGRVIFERPQNPILHEILIKSQIIVSFGIQRLDGGVLTVQLYSNEGTRDTDKPISTMFYQKRFITHDSGYVFDVIVPEKYLPSNGSGLVFKVEYYLSSPGNEQMPLLEAYEYALEYDYDEYVFNAVLISETKNARDKLYEA